MVLELRKVQTIDGHRIDCFIPSKESRLIDAEHLMLFPALIDPHVHFRTPGDEHKEDWTTAAIAAIAGGVTCVLDMPNNHPPCSTIFALHAKEEIVQKQLDFVSIPLRHRFYLGADKRHIHEIANLKGRIAGIKIYMGSSTGDLLVDDLAVLRDIFQIAAEHDLLVAVHAEMQALLQQRKKQFAGRIDPAVHSEIRSPEVAAAAVEQAILLAEATSARLYLAHVSSFAELALIRSAKRKSLPIYAEATPHHLFLDDSAYKKLGTLALVNPPLRSRKEQDALWEAIHDETIDTIGTDHAPHLFEEKQKPYGQAPSGLPSIEFYFSLLLNAHAHKMLSLKQIVSLTHTRPQQIFRLPIDDDAVLVDLNEIRTIEPSMIRSKAGWSPYLGMTLKGWPRYTVCKSRFYDLRKAPFLLG